MAEHDRLPAALICALFQTSPILRT